ncbi:MAG TPA: TrkH family potassium uptake protein [Planctomycetes bacterium]|nr:TrkH family potassium uptake protein [Planctomycetota bacterium]HIN80696.1 TrkH family potassium uptake protein [Planctomycetota bacterium]
MRTRALLSVLGLLVLTLACVLVAPLAIAWFYDSEEVVAAFLWSIGICTASGGFLYLANWGQHRDLGSREGFAVVGLGWAVLSAFAALPFWLSPSGIPNYLDAYFEAMSGFTTTGATILVDIEALPNALLFWRSLTQWLGGMGIVVLTVAILPFLGAGGYQMVRAEVPGPTADKLAPRIARTAIILWGVYFLLTLIETLMLWPVMGLFDAACHSFSTMATGGFSTKNASIAQFNSVYIEVVITVFMLLAGANIVLHYRAIFGKGVLYRADSEFRFYATMVVVATTLITLFLWLGTFPAAETDPERYGTISQCFRLAAFQVGAIGTGTGFVTADFDHWPNACRVILVLLMVIGGCAGSTAGGVKCIRILTLLKYGLREVRRLVRPHAVLPLKIGGETIDREIIARVMGFLALWLVVFVLAVLLMAVIIEPTAVPEAGSTPQGVSAEGVDGSIEDDALITAVGSVLAAIGNIGPGLGGVGPLENYEDIPDLGKLVLILLMLMGRLEIYAVLVLFIPLTWRR